MFCELEGQGVGQGVWEEGGGEVTSKEVADFQRPGSLGGHLRGNQSRKNGVHKPQLLKRKPVGF